MKLSTLFVLAGFAAAPLCQAAEPVAAEALPHTADQWAARMMDFTQNASAFSDPRFFVPYMNAMAEPAYWLQMGARMMNPESVARMMASMADPRAMQNYMQFANPAMVVKWMGAMMDPNFYGALMAQTADPDKMARWMAMPADPAWSAMATQAMNPAWPMQWMAAFMQQPFASAAPVATATP